MDMIINILIALIACFHLYFLWLEMFAWTTTGRKIFRGFPEDFFVKTKSLAANQGLYNGFLAAGLIWTFFIENEVWKFYISLFFLTCITLAGIFGAWTADKKIFFVQALPAIITIIMILI